MAATLAHVESGERQLRLVHRNEDSDVFGSCGGCWHYYVCRNPHYANSGRRSWSHCCNCWKDCRTDLESVHDYARGGRGMYCARRASVRSLADLCTRDCVFPCLFHLLFRIALSSAGSVSASARSNSATGFPTAATGAGTDCVAHNTPVNPERGILVLVCVTQTPRSLAVL